jgi:hypothetical protein
VTGAREILLLVGVDVGGLAGGPELAVAAPGVLGDAHVVLDCVRDLRFALGGDVDVDALELRAHPDDHLEDLERARPVAGDFDPDGQADAAVSICQYAFYTFLWDRD